MCFIIIIIIITIYGHDSRWSVIIWTASSAGSIWNFVDISQVASEEKLFNNFMILYMYTAQRQGKVNLAEQNFDCNLKLLLLQSYIASLRHFSYFCLCVCIHCSQVSLFYNIQLTLVISTSLISNNRLSWSENLSLLKHENLTTGKKILWKTGEIALREQFLLFSTIFLIYISNFKSPFTYIFVKWGCLNHLFLNSATLMCRGTDISKYFRESPGIRDNESRLYLSLLVLKRVFFSCLQISHFKKFAMDTKHSDRW